jgi:hypothetical protein
MAYAMLLRAILADPFRRKQALTWEKKMFVRTAVKSESEVRHEVVETRNTRTGRVLKRLESPFCFLLCVTPTLADTRYNNDAKADITFYNPSGGSVSVLFSNGDGNWEGGEYSCANLGEPARRHRGTRRLRWKRQNGYRLLLSGLQPSLEFGCCSAMATVLGPQEKIPAPAWVNCSGRGRGSPRHPRRCKTDLAFYCPGLRRADITVLFGNDDGSWRSVSNAVPAWANEPGVIALPGVYHNSGGIPTWAISLIKPTSPSSVRAAAGTVSPCC